MAEKIQKHSPVPAKNSIIDQERHIPRDVKGLGELLSRCGLQISWRRELGKTLFPGAGGSANIARPRSESFLTSARERSFKPRATRSGGALRHPSDSLPEDFARDAIAIMEQITWGRVPGEGRGNLLFRPF